MIQFIRKNAFFAIFWFILCLALSVFGYYRAVSDHEWDAVFFLMAILNLPFSILIIVILSGLLDKLSSYTLQDSYLLYIISWLLIVSTGSIQWSIIFSWLPKILLKRIVHSLSKSVLNLFNHLYGFHKSIEIAAICFSFIIGFYFVFETSATKIIDLIWVLSPYLVYSFISTWAKRSVVHNKYIYATKFSFLTCNTSIFIFLITFISYIGVLYFNNNSSSIFLFIPYYLLMGSPLLLYMQVSMIKILGSDKSDLGMYLTELSAIFSLGGLGLYIGSFLLIVLITSGYIYISGMSEIKTYYLTDITGLLGLLGLSISSKVLIRYKKNNLGLLICSLIVGMFLVFHTGVNVFHIVSTKNMYFADKVTILIKRYAYLMIIYIVFIRFLFKRLIAKPKLMPS